MKTYARPYTHGSSGFSVLELSIVLMITGILMASAINIYNNYQKQKKIYQTRASIETVQEASARFFAAYGFYPCVASMSVSPGRDEYGKITDCSDKSVEPGECNDHYCVASSMIDHDGDPATPDIEVRVRIGSVPFKQLSEGASDADFEAAVPYNNPYPISQRDTLDAEGNRLTYVVTESQATGEYIAGLGGIFVEDEYGRSLAEKVDYMVISHGDDGVGARSLQGESSVVECGSPKQADSENCNNDTLFVDALAVTASGTDHYDDVVAYRSWTHYFLWDTAGDSFEDIYNINTGNVGVGTMQPDERLHVLDGNLYADGDLYTENMCEEDGTDCFSADLIGGTTFPECASGQVMQGIAYEQPVCGTMITNVSNQTCPANSYIYGFQYDSASRTLSGLCRALPGS